ncbi:cupredoxin domain-containing protein [Paenibacillus marinisediminis]
MNKKVTIAAAMMALALALTACGSENSASSAEPSANETAASEVVIKAVNYKFEQEEYRVKAGEPIKFVLESTGNHGLKIEELGLELSPKKSSQVITPKVGTYDFKCNILCGPGHNGMTSKLIVE